MTDKIEANLSAVLPDDAAILARFAASDDDTIGLAAYALHRRALHGFRAAFRAQNQREPSSEEEAIFMFGEMSDARMAAYRASAAAMQGRVAGANGKKPARKARWPWFGMWVDAPLAPAGAPETINWRGLFGRLIVLFLAVVTTALLLRILVVKG